MRRRIVTLYLPLPMEAVGEVLLSIAEQFPNSTVEATEEHPDEIRVFTEVEE